MKETRKRGDQQQKGIQP